MVIGTFRNAHGSLLKNVIECLNILANAYGDV